LWYYQQQHSLKYNKTKIKSKKKKKVLSLLMVHYYYYWSHLGLGLFKKLQCVTHPAVDKRLVIVEEASHF